MPMLAETSISAPATTTGLVSASRIRSATPTAAAGAASTANSSPASRATVSAGRRTPPMRRPTSTSTSSPRLWPRLSLTALKSSMSTHRTPTGERSPAPPRASACVMRSNSRARLARPVSASCNVRWLSSSRLCRSPAAIALKESATWLSSVNDASSTRWARSPLPRRRAELRRSASGRRIDAINRRATSSVMMSVIAKPSRIPFSCMRWAARSRASWACSEVMTSSASRPLAVCRRSIPRSSTGSSERDTPRRATSGSSAVISRAGPPARPRPSRAAGAARSGPSARGAAPPGCAAAPTRHRGRRRATARPPRRRPRPGSARRARAAWRPSARHRVIR